MREDTDMQYGEATPDKEQDRQYRRELRRKRRKRNQLAAYTAVVVLIALFAMGIVMGVQALSGYGKHDTQEKQDKVEELLATESSIAVPEQPTETIVELTDEQKLDEIVDAGIAVMPLEDKVAGLFIVTPEAITGVDTAVKAGDGTKEALGKYSVGGIVYFGKNMRSEEQLKEMIDNTRLYANYPLFIAVDEEGGSVSRMAAAGIGTKVDTAQAIGETKDPAKAYEAASTIGGYLSELGFNLNFAPVADLNNVEGSTIGDRSYGSDATEVSEYVSNAVTAMEEQGVTACLKHFPGIGSTSEDTHDGRAISERTAEEFSAEEFAVFRAGIDAGADMVMVGHVIVPALTEQEEGIPCSLSEEVVTGILREEMDFDGVIITDAMNMGAISEYYESDQAAVLALRAGCDMILMPEDFEKAYNGVLQAVQDGTISEERINDSLRRIYRIKYADKIR